MPATAIRKIATYTSIPAFMVSSPTVFESCTQPLRHALCGRRLPLWFEGGREVRRKGRGDAQPTLRGMPTGRLYPQRPAFGGPVGGGSSSPGCAAKTDAVLPSSAEGPDCKSPSLPALLPHGQALKETQFYGPGRITGPSAFFF